MTRYNELSEAVEAWMGPQIEEDRLYQQLPMKICEAVHRKIEAHRDIWIAR